jgi:hypothetical protein
MWSNFKAIKKKKKYDFVLFIVAKKLSLAIKKCIVFSHCVKIKKN